MNTTIYLGSVMWNNKYAHVVDFQTETKRRAWFMNNFIEHAKTTKLLDREQGDLETDVLTYNEMLERGYNYMYVEEFDERVDKTFKWFAFITALERTNKDTVIIRYELDYWQTYFFKPNGDKAVTDILDTFVKREHVDRWSTTSTPNVYKPIYSRTIEGLEVGEMLKEEQSRYDYYLYKNGEKTDIGVTPYLVIHNDSGTPYYTYDTSINGMNLQDTRMFLMLRIDTHKDVYYRNNSHVGNDGAHDLLIDNNFNGHLNVQEGVFDIKNFDTKLDNIIKIIKLNYLPFRLDIVEEDDDDMVISTVDDMKVLPTNRYVQLVPLSYRKDGNNLKRYHALLIETYRHIPYTDNTRRYQIGEIKLPLLSHIVNINDNASMSFEPKLDTREFTYHVISSSKSENLTLYYENFNDDVKLYLNNSLDVWTYDEVVVTNYGNDDVFNNLRTKLNNELMLSNDAYLNYMKNNREQIQTTQNVNATKTAIGVASILAGSAFISSSVFTGGGGLGMGLGLIAGGLGSTVSGVGNIVSESAKQYDYKNRLDETKSSANTLMIDIAEGKDKYYLTKYKIHDKYKERVYQLLMKQGYLVNEYRKPNLTSRYYYNYIQCSYVEINPQAIPQDAVRRIIENIYLNGTTIWHYRNPNTFRLIDYSFENWEMSLNPSGQ